MVAAFDIRGGTMRAKQLALGFMLMAGASLAASGYAATQQPDDNGQELREDSADAPPGIKNQKYDDLETLQSFSNLNTSSLRLRSAAALVINQNNGKTLYAKNAALRTPIASITKLMTAMVMLDANLPLDEQISIGYDDLDSLRGTTSRLRVGETLSRRELLQLALMSSENRAASALARNHPGGLPAFINAMNRKAKELGMLHTTFADASGLHSGNMSTAEDVAKMVRASYRYPLIRLLTTAKSYQFIARNNRRLAFTNTNALVKNKNWRIGLSKTGYTSDSGRCLVMQASIAKQPVIIVLLDSVGKYTRIGDAIRIKKWIESRKPGKQRFG